MFIIGSSSYCVYGLNTMATLFEEVYFLQETVDQVSSFCSGSAINHGGFYSTAWLFTNSLYTCMSDCNSSLVQRSGQEDSLSISTVSAKFTKQMTIRQACSSTQIGQARILDNDGLVSSRDLEADFLQGGTPIWIGDFEPVHTEVSHVFAGQLPQCFLLVDGTQVRLRYTPHFVPAYSPGAFLDTFVQVVTQFVCQPADTCLSDLDVLGPFNRTILGRWASSKLVRTDRCIHHYVDQHAASTPEKEAVISTEGPQFNYAELSRLSGKLAAHLVSLGIKKGDIVPILFDKSSIAVLAVVSIMKAGAAYVGFSADSPINCLRECAAIADVPLVITSSQHQDLVQKIGRSSLVLDSEFLTSLEACPDTSGFESPAKPCDLAYLVFTSGSTGVPKVCICPR